jgi:S-adenosylmethionine hydrolase
VASHLAIYFLSDYGNADEFVGVVHAVVHRLSPTTPVIDLSHQIAPFDIAAGAAMLARAAPYLGPGVALAVVDPGVGSMRRGIAVRCRGDGPEWLVGPDNGLLVPASRILGGASHAFALEPERLTTASVQGAAGRTFDGRDVFAPAACHLLSGGDPLAIGAAFEVGALTNVALDDQTPGPVPAAGSSTVWATVVWIDHYGNVQLDLLPSVLDEIGVGANSRATVVVASDPMSRPTEARRVRTFGELGAGELGLTADSNGRVALVLDRASAATHLQGLRVGVTVRIDAAGR